MRIALALSLIVLQHLAPGDGRSSRTLHARNADDPDDHHLHDLLRPLLKQLDDDPETHHNKKRVLEIMPIPNKGSKRKTPLLILASEIPTHDLKKKLNFDNHSLATSKRNSKIKKHQTSHRSDEKHHDEALREHSSELVDRRGFKGVKSHGQKVRTYSTKVVNDKKHKKIRDIILGESDEHSKSEEESDMSRNAKSKSILKKIMDFFHKLSNGDVDPNVDVSKEEHSNSAEDIKAKHGKVATKSSESRSSSSSSSEEAETNSKAIHKNDEESEKIHETVHQHSNQHNELENHHVTSEKHIDPQESSRAVSEKHDVSDASVAEPDHLAEEDNSLDNHRSHAVHKNEHDVSTEVLPRPTSQEVDKEPHISKDVIKELIKQVHDRVPGLSKEIDQSDESLPSQQYLIEQNNEDSALSQEVASAHHVSSDDKHVHIDVADVSGQISDSDSLKSGGSPYSSHEDAQHDTYDELSNEHAHDSLSGELVEAKLDDVSISAEGVHPAIQLKQETTNHALKEDSMQDVLQIGDRLDHGRPTIVPSVPYGKRDSGTKEMHKNYRLSFRFNK